MAAVCAFLRIFTSAVRPGEVPQLMIPITLATIVISSSIPITQYAIPITKIAVFAQYLADI